MSADDLSEAARWATAWLFETALPLWAEHGVDAAGGFHDQLDAAARPVDAPKRLRVQARQVVVYAEAGRLGWSGPWRAMVDHGLAFLRGPARRGDGLVHSTFEAAAGGGGLDLYDHAFLLLALAHGLEATGEIGLAAEAEATWRALEQRFPGRGLGFLEPPPTPAALYANSHMHLYEAAQAWRRLHRGPLAWKRRDAARWADRCAMFVDLANNVFTDHAECRLTEYFDADGAPAAGALGDLVDTGHQFEWGWLLLNGHDREAIDGEAGRARSNARLLILTATRTGVDRRREVAVHAQHRDGRILEPDARLWTQTERLRGVLAMRREQPAEAKYWTDEALRAFGAIQRYLAEPGGGLYRDVMRADGGLVAEPAKASTLYHLMGAFTALRQAADG